MLCRPTSVKPGPKVTPPFSETWEALEKCVEEGLIKSIGVSNFSPEKIETFMPGAKIRPAVNQVRYHCPILYLATCTHKTLDAVASLKCTVLPFAFCGTGNVVRLRNERLVKMT